MRHRFYNDFIKRIADFILSVIGLGVLFLPMLAIAVAVKTDSKGPVFYRGERGGYHGKVFRIYKFRTMVVDAERLGGLTTGLNDPRITALGGFLRKTKLDELPQLFNVIKGEMSFIGPRPEVLKYVRLYQGDEKRILDVRPGITDISSITLISLDEIVGEIDADENFEKYVLPKKNAMRVQYVKTQSPWLDFKLFLLTVVAVLKKAARILARKSGGED